MNEKRFVIGDDNIAMFEVIDMEKEELVCECRAVDVEKVVDLLNELSDEKGQLKDENEQLKHYKLYEDNKRLQTILADLKKENEKLKAKVKRLQDIATRTEEEKEHYADLYCKCENELIKNGRRCDGV